MSTPKTILDKYLATRPYTVYIRRLPYIWIPPEPLATAVAIIGLIPSLTYATFYDYGKGVLTRRNVTEADADVIVSTYGACGVLLVALHIALYYAAKTYNEVVILLYMWSVIVFSVIDVGTISYLFYRLFSKYCKFKALLMILVDFLFWIFVYGIILPIINGFRQNIHSVYVMVIK